MTGSIQKIALGEQKRSKRSPSEPQDAPRSSKGSQRVPNGAKMESKRVPKGAQNGTPKRQKNMKFNFLKIDAGLERNAYFWNLS